MPNFVPASEFEIEMTREPREKIGAVTGDARMENEFVFVDEAEFGKRERQRHAARRNAPARRGLQTADGFFEVCPANNLRIPGGARGRIRDNIFLRRVDRAREGHHPFVHPVRPLARLGDRPPGLLHHFIDGAAEKERVRRGDALRRVMVQSLGRDARFMIAAAVERDVYGVAERLHEVMVVGGVWGKHAESWDAPPTQRAKHSTLQH